MNRGTLFWGLILVIVGVVFTLDNFNLIGGVRVWDILWPSLIILFGLWVALRPLMRGKLAHENVVVPLQGETTGTLRIDFGAGVLKLADGSQPENMLDGNCDGGAMLNVSRGDKTVDSRLRLPEGIFPNVGFAEQLRWDLHVTREIPLHVEIHSGASENKLDFSQLKVTDLRVQSGASSTEITLPGNAGNTDVHINAGAASVTVRVPQSAAARITARGGLSSINIDQTRFPRNGQFYQSSDYGTAQNKIDLDIEIGVGSAEIM